MGIILQFQNLLYFVSSSVVIFGFLITVFYIWHNFKAGLIEKLIGFIFICIAYVFWIEFLIHFNFMIYLPHFFRTGALASLIFMPLMYLVLLKSLSGKLFRWFDGFHILPFLIYLVNFLPFFLKSSAYKQAHLDQFTSLEDLYIFKEGWLFSNNFIFVIRFLQILFYLFAILFLLKKYAHKLKESKVTKKLAIVFTSILGMYFLITLNFIFRPFEENNEEYSLIAYMVTTLLFFVFFLLNPEILFNYNFLVRHFEITGEFARRNENLAMYNIEPTIRQFSTEIEDDSPLLDKDKIHLAKIEQYLSAFKPYLKEDFTLKRLEEDVDISAKRIRKIIKLKYQINFPQYINNLRINYVLYKLNSDSNWRNYSIKAIANNVGFSSPNSFYNYFKEFTGSSPRNYIEKINYELLNKFNLEK